MPATSPISFPPILQQEGPDGKQESLHLYLFADERKHFFRASVRRQAADRPFVNKYRLESVSADSRSFEFVTVRIENLPPGRRAKKWYRVVS